MTCWIGSLLRTYHHHSSSLMDSWRVAALGDGGVGKTALAVQVSDHGNSCVVPC